MREKQADVFVMWHRGMEEDTASIFLAALRDAGLRVKIVGDTPTEPVDDLCGDITLEEGVALANGISCLIVPGSLSTVQQFATDPHWEQLITKLHTGRAWVVIEQSPNSIDIPAAFPGRLLTYPPGEELPTFATALATALEPV